MAVNVVVRGLPAVSLVLLAACGVVSSDEDARLDVAAARALKAGVESNLDESFGAAIRATRGTPVDAERFLQRWSCSELPTDEINLRASAAFRVHGLSVDEVKTAVSHEWMAKGWSVKESILGDTNFTAGTGRNEYFGSATVSSFPDESGERVVGVVIRTESVCVRLSKSLEREGWPTTVDDS